MAQTAQQPVLLKGQVQRFRFTLSDTLGDIALVVRQLEKEGRAAHIRFVGLTTEDITAAEVLAEYPAIMLTPAGRDAIEEMAVVGDDLPDPAVAERARDEDVRWAGVTDETAVYFDGNWTPWGDLAGNERRECYFNDDGVLVGSFPFGWED